MTTTLAPQAVRRARARAAAIPPSLPLSLAMFATQSALLTLSPILSLVADDLGVSTALAGQLRAVCGLAAGIAVALLGPLARRVGLRDLLSLGLVLILAGVIGSAFAGTFAVLAVAQVGVGVGLSLVLSAGLAAARSWAPGGSRTLFLALAAQPVAWVLGMPIVGSLAEHGWRWAWLVPGLAAGAALLMVGLRPADAPTSHSAGIALVRGDGRVRRWVVGEALAYAAWSGTLVFAGSLLRESYGLRASAVGALLGAGAVAYLPGSHAARRWRVGPPLLARLALLAAAGTAAFGLARFGVAWSIAMFGVLAFLGGARTMSGSAMGLDAAPGREVDVMGLRTLALQVGNLLGVPLGGLALAAGGYPALGLALGGVFVLAAAPHVSRRARTA